MTDPSTPSPRDARAKKDIRLGAKSLAESTCDECPEHAYTRWYSEHGTTRERIQHTFCKAHNEAFLAESEANRKRLGLV